MQLIIFQKWFVQVNIVIKKATAPVDSGDDMNCIQEGLVPSKYFEKIMHFLMSTSGTKMKIKYKLSEMFKFVIKEFIFLLIFYL